MSELSNEDVQAYKNFVRVEPAMFHKLLVRLGPRITKEDTWYSVIKTATIIHGRPRTPIPWP